MTKDEHLRIISVMSTPLAEVNKNTMFDLTRQVSVVIADRDGKPHQILADTNSDVPRTFELLKVGMWRTPNHGDIMVMPTDGQAYIDNFKAGVGVSGDNMGKLPINYAHDSSGKAAGWFVPSFDGETLWATLVEWTPAAKEALQGGEWKCISAEFCPAGRGGWCDPLDAERYIDNVLTGAALTNIPLMSQLKPVMASASFGKNDTMTEVFLITASKETPMPTLQEVVTKDVATLTDEDKAVLKTHEADLTDEQKTKFGIEVTAAPVADATPTPPTEEPEVPEVTPTPVDQELAAVSASIKSGESVVIKASTLKELTDMKNEYRHEKAANIVASHLQRGAIVADQAGNWTERLVKDASLEDLLKTLPSNSVVASEVGSSTNGAETSATEMVKNRANALITASKDRGETLSIGDAYSQVMAADTELTDRYNAEIKG